MSARRSKRLSGEIRRKWALLGSPFEPLMSSVPSSSRSQSASITSPALPNSDFPLRRRHPNAPRPSPLLPLFFFASPIFPRNSSVASLLRLSPSDPRHCLVFSSEEHMQAGIHTLCPSSHTHSETLQILSSAALSSSLTHHVSRPVPLLGHFSPKY